MLLAIDTCFFCASMHVKRTLNMKLQLRTKKALWSILSLQIFLSYCDTVTVRWRTFLVKLKYMSIQGLERKYGKRNSSGQTNFHLTSWYKNLTGYPVTGTIVNYISPANFDIPGPAILFILYVLNGCEEQTKINPQNISSLLQSMVRCRVLVQVRDQYIQ